MVTGFLRLNGQTVGAVANRTEVYDAEGTKTDSFDAVLTRKGAEKAAECEKMTSALFKDEFVGLLKEALNEISKS